MIQAILAIGLMVLFCVGLAMAIFIIAGITRIAWNFFSSLGGGKWLT